MPAARPPFLVWMKRKIAQSRSGLVNLAISGVSTDFANRWQREVLTVRAAEIVARSAETNQFGLESLKRAIRAAYELPAHREIVTSLGASGGFRLVCEMLLAGRAGAQIVIESPVYEPLRAIPERLGAQLVFAPRDDLVANLARSITQKTVAVVLSNLHNPTGSWLPHEKMAHLASELRAIGSSALVVVDETFLDLGPQPGTTAAGVHPRVVTISSLSKSHGLPALRCGWVTADPTVLPVFVEDAVLFQNIGGKVAEVLGAMAMEEIDGFRQAARQHLERNRALVADWLNEMTGLGLVEPLELPPSCIIFPRLLVSGSTARLVDELEARHEVLVAPGWFFGEGCDDRIRIGFGGDHGDLARGLGRLADGLKAARRSGWGR
jgi:aspartate/methionine/tyrosine aminotransferase